MTMSVLAAILLAVPVRTAASPRPPVVSRALPECHANGDAEPGLDTVEDSGEARFGDAVENPATVAVSFEKTAVIHQTQMPGSHMRGNITRGGKLSDRVGPLHQHLNHT